MPAPPPWYQNGGFGSQQRPDRKERSQSQIHSSLPRRNTRNIPGGATINKNAGRAAAMKASRRGKMIRQTYYPPRVTLRLLSTNPPALFALAIGLETMGRERIPTGGRQAAAVVEKAGECLASSDRDAGTEPIVVGSQRGREREAPLRERLKASLRKFLRLSIQA